MAQFDVRPANAADIPILTSLEHSSMSDYVWQLELRREAEQVVANFREVRLPRSIEVTYPRSPYALAEEWTRRGVVMVALHDSIPVGYMCMVEDAASRLGRCTDIVISPEYRRRGAGSALLEAGHAWARERSLRHVILEIQSKNHAFIRMAQKFGYEFCGYNDQYYPTQDVALFFARTVK